MTNGGHPEGGQGEKSSPAKPASDRAAGPSQDERKPASHREPAGSTRQQPARG